MFGKRSGAVVAALVLAAGPCAAQAGAAQATSFTIVGSTAMYTDGALLSNRYMATRPGVQIAVNPTNGLDAFDSACRGEAAIGMSELFIQNAQLREPGCGSNTNRRRGGNPGTGKKPDCLGQPRTPAAGNQREFDPLPS